jgi:hypothetical protein
MNAPIDAAAQLLDRGLHVFPADHPDHRDCIGKHGPDNPCDGIRGKHPAVKWGTFATTVTPQMIDLAWEKHGGLANIAVACGPSNLVILDEDEEGEIERWCDTYDITLPDTYTVTTGRGQHLYYRWDHTTHRIGNSPKAMDGFKIDVRGHGGYAIAEGSQHALGGVYTGNGQPIAELPDQIAELLLAGKPPEPEQVWENITSDPNNTKIGFGDRHKALVRYGCRLRKSGLDYKEAEVVFRERWLLCEQPEGQIPEARFHSTACPYPVTWKEAKTKLRDVYGRYTAGQNLDDKQNGRNIIVTRGSAVTPRRIEWWEPDIIVKDAINLLAAREGEGKSTVAASWSARETHSGGTVMWIGTEESREHAQAPRLIAAGADMDRIVFVDVEITTETAGIPGALHFPLDLPHIENVIRQHQVTLIVLDPCKGMVPPDFQGNDDVAVRQYLEPIAQLCARCNVTLIGLVHFGKRESRDPGKLILGSVAWSQVARSVISIAEDHESGNRVLTNTKTNYSPRARSIEFRIVSHTIDTAEGPSALGAVEWIGDTTKDARELLGKSEFGDHSDEFDEWDYTDDLKASWLYKYLADANRVKVEVRPKEAVGVGADKGISRASVFRLFDKLANAGMAESVDGSGFPRVTHWRLVAETTESADPDAKNSETTETTGADLRKQGETTGPLWNTDETTEKTTSDKAKLSVDGTVVSVVSPDPRDTPTEPPGGITTNTPGMTDRVIAALGKASPK